ncbi:MAG: hypothetical protein H6644_19305 [Caldilineaceae bacterium]|nr:hypothetical protein [Caldilineaceae bacterium]
MPDSAAVIVQFDDHAAPHLRRGRDRLSPAWPQVGKRLTVTADSGFGLAVFAIAGGLPG